MALIDDLKKTAQEIYDSLVANQGTLTRRNQQYAQDHAGGLTPEMFAGWIAPIQTAIQDETQRLDDIGKQIAGISANTPPTPGATPLPPATSPIGTPPTAPTGAAPAAASTGGTSPYFVPVPSNGGGKSVFAVLTSPYVLLGLGLTGVIFFRHRLAQFLPR